LKEGNSLMPSSPQLSQKELERMLAKTEAETLTMRHLYVAARTATMNAILRNRDFDYCREQEGIFGPEEDDLRLAILREMNQAVTAFKTAKRAYFEMEKEAEDLRTTIRILKEYTLAQ
jgi:hypothetical protein